MGGRPFTVLHLAITVLRCAICSEPVNLTVDLSTDEKGKAVHEECYVKYLTGSWPVAGWHECN
jgi:hypothetical protein